ncbi:hypothetical protein WR25_05474 isoform A [Diploscapter pachys]|uniref:Transthyretin-like family protein n=1 Tax=Diploscapter pachys TaxID=2018661 RepID=A0A2A2LWT6_9BILA|nr:hypothetical protein WR25_05474 isoform A [Diploscapter pachys]
MRKILGDFNYLAILQKMNGFIVFCVLALSLVASSLAEKQNITIKGIALCNKRTMANAHVELMEKDTIDPNDLLAEIHTNKEGEFQLFAEEDEIGTIEPYVRITHGCNAKPGCSRIAEFKIDPSYIGKTYDMTFVTLDIYQTGETEECN